MRPTRQVLVTVLSVGLLLSPALAGSSDFIRGSLDGDGDVDLVDAIICINYLIVSGPVPTCLDAADMNDDGTINIVDPLYLLYHLFITGTTPPPPPFPGCGSDPTPDSLDCAEHFCP